MPDPIGKLTISFDARPTFLQGNKVIDLETVEKQQFEIRDKNGNPKKIEGFLSDSGVLFRLRSAGSDGKFRIEAYGTPEQLAKSNLRVRNGDITKARVGDDRYIKNTPFKARSAFEIDAMKLDTLDVFAMTHGLERKVVAAMHEEKGSSAGQADRLKEQAAQDTKINEARAKGARDAEALFASMGNWPIDDEEEDPPDIAVNESKPKDQASSLKDSEAIKVEGNGAGANPNVPLEPDKNKPGNDSKASQPEGGLEKSDQSDAEFDPNEKFGFDQLMAQHENSEPQLHRPVSYQKAGLSEKGVKEPPVGVIEPQTRAQARDDAKDVDDQRVSNEGNGSVEGADGQEGDIDEIVDLDASMDALQKSIEQNSNWVDDQTGELKDAIEQEDKAFEEMIKSPSKEYDSSSGGGGKVGKQSDAVAGASREVREKAVAVFKQKFPRFTDENVTSFQQHLADSKNSRFRVIKRGQDLKQAEYLAKKSLNMTGKSDEVNDRQQQFEKFVRFGGITAKQYEAAKQMLEFLKNRP